MRVYSSKTCLVTVQCYNYIAKVSFQFSLHFYFFYLYNACLQEINFPTCDQSELELISILDPDDLYPTFQSQPHYCGQVISQAVDFQQSGEQKWKIVLKTNPKGIYSFAAFSFSVRK